MKIVITGENLEFTRIDETAAEQRAARRRKAAARLKRDREGRWMSADAYDTQHKDSKKCAKFKRFFVLAKELEG